jgi:hypothetical protein
MKLLALSFQIAALVFVVLSNFWPTLSTECLAWAIVILNVALIILWVDDSNLLA